MRKILMALLAAWVLAGSLLLPVWAEPAGLHEFTVTGQFGAEAAGEECTLRVFRPGGDADAPELGADVVFLDQKDIDENGAAAFSVRLRGGEGIYPYILRSASGAEQAGQLEIAPDTGDGPEGYYIVDDDFNMLKANGDDPLDNWGWDVLEDGGSFDYSATSFVMKDTDSAKRLRIRRQFEPQTDGQMSLEFRFSQKTLQDGAAWELCGGAVAAVRLETRGGKVYAGATEAFSYQAGTVYGVRLDLNLADRTYDLMINGVVKGTDIAFEAQPSAVDSLIVSTGREATGEMNFKPVRIHRGFLVEEKWIAYTPGNLAAGAWTPEGNVTVGSMASVTPPDTYSAVLADNSQTEYAAVSKPLPNLSGRVTLEYKFYSAQQAQSFTASLKDACDLRAAGGELAILQKDGTWKKAVDLKPNLWNTIRIALNTRTGIADVMLNGKQVLTGANVCEAGAVSQLLTFATGESQTDTIWLDDIRLKWNNPLPEDYVPEPVTMAKAADAPLVGIQTCDLWHEGKHFGWDKINQDPLRKPYLGYYDDGSSEGKDWEIKYMAEHGIDFSIHCWYRPAGTGSPIKDPRNGASIHDGLFGAQYRDKIKFAIAWENGGGASTNETDFRENIVPFWMEYYFKDSGYLVVDNKPVIGIYNYNGLAASFGEANIKPQLDFLRQACREAGFDGAYLLGVTGSSSAQTLQKFADAGFDATYCYSWGTGGYQVASQKAAITAQKNADVLPIIPTLAMGRDDTPWNRSAGGFLKPAELYELAKWTKEEFLPACGGSGLDGRMVMLDNWNEYGEGHFFMPAELAGYDYLEAIGQVFGQPQHTDVRPTDAQQARLCRLYARRRTVPTLPAKPIPPTYAKTGWYFEQGIEGFSATGQVTGLTASSGALSGTAVGTDPIVYSPDHLNIDLTDVSYLRVRLKNGTAGTSSKVYFVTQSDSAYSEAKAVSWPVGSQMEGFADYLIPVGENALWKGTLKQLRFDPAEATGSFAYESIELLRDAPEGSNLITGGDMEGEAVPTGTNAQASVSGWDYETGWRSLACRTTSPLAEVSFDVPLSAGKSYLLSVAGHAPESTVPAELVLSFQLEGVVQEIRLANAELGADGWTYISGRAAVPAGDVSNGKLIVRIKAADATVYLDNAAAYTLPSLEIENAGFFGAGGGAAGSIAQAGETVTYRATVRNLSGEPVTIYPWLASFRGGAARGVDGYDAVHVEAGGVVEIALSVPVSGCDLCRMSIWNGELQPLTNVSELK